MGEPSGVQWGDGEGRAALIRTPGPTGVGREPLVETTHQQSHEHEPELPFRGPPFSPGHTPLLIQPRGSSKPPGMRRALQIPDPAAPPWMNLQPAGFPPDLPGPPVPGLDPVLGSHLKLRTGGSFGLWRTWPRTAAVGDTQGVGSEDPALPSAQTVGIGHFSVPC